MEYIMTLKYLWDCKKNTIGKGLFECFLMPFDCVGAFIVGRWKRTAGKSIKKIFADSVSKDAFEGSATKYVYVVKKNIVTLKNVQ